MGSRVHPRVRFPNPHPHPNPLDFYLYGFVGSRVINSPPKPDPTWSGSSECLRMRVKLSSLVILHRANIQAIASHVVGGLLPTYRPRRVT